MNNNFFGVMQGRLLPKYKGRYQAHPLGYWADEFYIAKDLGLDCIEFILDYEASELNPLLAPGGKNEINSVILKTNVHVKTICADYFMDAPLHSSDKSVVRKSTDILRKLLDTSNEIGVDVIVLPCVDKSSLDTDIKISDFVSNLTPIVRDMPSGSIKLALETDLSPKLFSDLLNKFDSDKVTVNYDIGNSAALGYCIKEELMAYGSRISDIHIKDRILHGESVLLGKGNADFTTFFQALKKYNYKGPFIMQAFRDDEGLSIFKEQLQWIKLKIEECK